MIEVAEAMATGWERAPQRELQRSAARRIGSNGSATSLSTPATLAVRRSGPTDHSHLGGPGDLMHPGGSLEPEAMSVVDPLRPGVIRDNARAQRFYDRHGFRIEGATRVHEVTGASAMRMVRRSRATDRSRGRRGPA